MKHVRMMILSDCPYCHQAFVIEEELKKENPAYAAVVPEVIDESVHPEIADSLNYYYVPCYFVDGKKIFEGVPDEEKIKAVYEAALS